MSAEIVDINEFKLARAAAGGTELLQGRFDEPLTATTRTGDLADTTVAGLIGYDRQVIGFAQLWATRILGLGQTFEALTGEARLKAMEAHLAILDQLRLESLHRLKWLSEFPGRAQPLVALALDPGLITRSTTKYALAESHPDYPEFRLRRDTEGVNVVRRLIPTGVQLFIARVNRPKNPSPA